MKNVKHIAIPSAVSLAAASFLFSYVDRSESRVVIAAGGFGLFLAWYSILDLREQRGERWLPHTLDRLLRATFTVITLGFVVNLGLPSAPAIVEPTLPQPTQSFIRKIEDLASKDSTWNRREVAAVLDHHFEKQVKYAGDLTLFLEGDRKLTLIGHGAPPSLSFRLVPNNP